jgi:hypothetical protein
MRRLYAKSIKVIDTAELDKAIRDIDHERQMRKRAEQEASELKLRFQILRDELTVEKEKYKNLLEKMSLQQQQSGVDSSLCVKTTGEKSSSSVFSYSLEKMINLTEVCIILLAFNQLDLEIFSFF